MKHEEILTKEKAHLNMMIDKIIMLWVKKASADEMRSVNNWLRKTVVEALESKFSHNKEFKDQVLKRHY